MTALLMVAYVANFVAHATALAAQVAHTVALAVSNIDFDDTVSWGLILGVVTPLLTSIVQRPNWSSSVRTGVGVAVSVVIGFVTCLADGSIGSAETVLATVAAVVVVAASTYQNLWKPSTIAPKLEAVTSPAARHAA
jgi:hypothetical protein